MSCVGCRAGRLSGPLLSLTLLTVALLTGFNRVAEYRNHWTDVLSGQAVGATIAVFLVVYVVQVFRESPEMIRSSSDNTINTDEQVPHMNHTEDDDDDKYIMATTPGSFNEVT